MRSLDNMPTPRRGEELPADHPLVLDPQSEVTCVADVPASLLDTLTCFYGDIEPADTDVNQEDLT